MKIHILDTRLTLKINATNKPKTPQQILPHCCSYIKLPDVISGGHLYRNYTRKLDILSKTHNNSDNNMNNQVILCNTKQDILRNVNADMLAVLCLFNGSRCLLCSRRNSYAGLNDMGLNK